MYNRFARGEEVFADPSAAVEFIELLKQKGPLIFSQANRLDIRTGRIEPGAQGTLSDAGRPPLVR